MRKLLLVVFALAALSMIAPASVYAEFSPGPYQSMIGLYLDEDDPTSFVKSEGVLMYETAYLILLNPYFNYLEGVVGESYQPVTQIQGFEIRVGAPVGQTIMLLPSLPNSQTIGLAPDYVVGCDPTPIVGGFIKLADITFVGVNTVGVNEYFLGPVTDQVSIPGQMCGTGVIGEGDLDVFAIFPTSGAHDAPVLVLNPDGEVTPTENDSWSNVKALYR